MRIPFQRVCAVAAALTAIVSVRAQLQPEIQYQGAWCPVAKVARDYIEVVKDDKRHIADNEDLKLVAAPDFAPGFVEVRDVQADLDPLRDAKPTERAKTDAVRFRYTANLVADRSLSNCYALLTFLSEGSVGTKLIPVGHLSAGASHSIKLELTTNVSRVGSLHVFTEGHEVGSTDHPGKYDLAKYYAELSGGGGGGLSAASLLKGAKDYPHVLSDDGTKVVTVREKDGALKLIVVDLLSMKTLTEVRVADANAYFVHPTWVSSHEIAYVAEDDIENYPGRLRLLLLDIESLQITPLLDRIANIVRQSRSHPSILALHDYGEGGQSFFTYDVHTRRTISFNQPSYGAGVVKFDFEGRPRVLEVLDSSTEHYLVRTTADGHWSDLDGSVHQPGLRFDAPASHLLERIAEVVDLGPDGDTAYIGSRLNSDRFELDAYSLSQGRILRTIARLPQNDLTNSDFLGMELLFAHHDNRLLGLFYEDTLPHVAWLDPRFAAIQQRLDAALPGHLNFPIDWTDDGATLIYLSFSDQDAGTYYAFQPMRGRLIPLLQRNARLERAKLGKIVPIRFLSRDGQSIPAYVTRPPGEARGPLPLIAFVHGGPTLRDFWTFNPWVQFLATRGYIVLQVNYRGSSGYGAAFQKAGLESRFDGRVLDDIADGVKYLIDRGEADPRRVVVAGASFGGWATYMSLIKYPKLYCAGIAISAVSDWRELVSDDRWMFSNDLGSAYFKGLMQRQRELGVEQLIEPVDRAAELHQPILIMHGLADVTVDARQSARMVDALKATNPTVVAKQFAHSTHTYWPFAENVERMNSAAAFLEKYAPPAESTSTEVASKQ